MRAIGIPVYLLPGNHDPLDAASVYTSALFIAECPENVTVLDRAGVHEVRPGLQIVAAPWRSKKPTSDLVSEVLDGLPADGVTRIVVGHGGVDIFEPDKDKPSLIRLAALEAAIERGAVHYIALGDKHSRTQVGSTGRIWYSGSPEVTNYDDIEPDPGHVLIVDIDEDDPRRPVRVDARRVGRWRFVTLCRTVDSSRDVADLDINLDLMPDKERTVVRLGLSGSLTVTDKAALDACLDKYARLFAALVPWDKQTDIAVIPADGEFDDLGIGGFAAAAVDELVNTARSDGEDADDAPRGAGAVAAPRRQGRRMKLHRLVLTNYRGITHREIEFPDHGVVVVSGANEIGKSSMIEALDLLVHSKDRSNKKDVKQVKPTHADVGAEITAEISTGSYRFIYHKRFHKRCETQLTVVAPRREQLTGDEAHERVLALLDETVDMELWQAQRVLQAASTAAVDLSGCDALSRALDVAAGEAAALSGAEPLLIDRIDAEYLRYYTPTGRPTGEWAAAIKRLHEADDEVAQCAAAVAEVDDAVRRHTALTDNLSRLTEERAEATKRLTEARLAAEAVNALTQQLKQAEIVAAAADATHTASVSALTERRRLRADIDQRTGAIAALEAAAAEALDELATAAEVQEAAEVAAEGARGAVETSQARVDVARRVAERVSDRDEANRLETRLGKLDAARRELDRVEHELAGIVLTDDTMRAIETAAVAVERAAGQAELASAHIELVAMADVDVQIDGDPVTIQAGGHWAAGVSSPTDIELPGLLRVRVVPGAPASDSHAKLQAAQEVLAAALAKARVADVAAARLLDERRRELIASREKLNATSEALVGDDTVDELRTRLAELRDGRARRAGPVGRRCRRPGRRPRGPRRRGGRTQAGHGRLRDASQGRRSRGEAAGGEDDPRQRRPRETRRRADRTDRRTREVDPAAGDGDR